MVVGHSIRSDERSLKGERSLSFELVFRIKTVGSLFSVNL